MLSIIIPAYNSERIIERTLESIVKQKYHGIEVIVIDDCSRDNVAKVAERFLSRHNLEYKVIRNRENLGLAKSINKGIRLCNKKSEFVVVLQHDIAFIDEDWIGRAVKHFRDKRVVVVSGKYTIPRIDNLNLMMKFCSLKYFRQSIRNDGVYEVSFLEDRCNIYRREILMRYLFNKDFRISGEDQDLAYRWINDGYKLMYDSSLVYETFLSGHQDSYIKVLKHEMDYAVSQVDLNLRYWGSIKKGTRDSNLRGRMTFRLVQVCNSLLVIIFLLLQRWDVLIIIFILRYAYSFISYLRFDRDYGEVIMFSFLDYFTDFAYFIGAVIGGLKACWSR